MNPAVLMTPRSLPRLLSTTSSLVITKTSPRKALQGQAANHHSLEQPPSATRRRVIHCRIAPASSRLDQCLQEIGSWEDAAFIGSSPAPQ